MGFADKEEYRKNERHYLGIYTLVAGFFMVYLYLNAYGILYFLPEILSIGIGWGVYVSSAMEFRRRAEIWVLCMLVEYLFFGCIAKEFYAVLIFYVLLVMLVSSFETRGLSLAICATYVGILIVHLVFIQDLDLKNDQDLFKIVCAGVIIFVTEMLTKWHLLLVQERTSHLEYVIGGLKQAEQAKDEFLANVSHELRTPLNTVAGMCEMLLTQNLTLEEKEQVGNIKVAGKHLQNLISDILDYSELQAGKIELVESNYNMASVVNDVVNMVAVEHEEQGIEFIVDCDAAIPSGLLGDADKLKRILFCLVDNAFKFTETGYVRLSLSARREAYGVNLLISVKDSGIGMAPETIEKIYEQYNQADAKKNRRQEGIGLGLTITRSIVELMGGFIHIESVLGQGTEIKIMIPQKVIDEAPLTKVTDAERLNIAFYVNDEKYGQSDTLSVYLGMYQHIAESLEVTYTRCQTIAKLKYGIQRGRYTHIFMNAEEYEDHKEFLDEVAMQVPVILILDQECKMQIDKRYHLIYKPFSVFHIAAALNGEYNHHTLMGQTSEREQVVVEGAKILAVDDNAMNLRVLDGLLKQYKLSVDKAMSGPEAIVMVQQSDYDLVFMDHMMPGMDGIETFREIRKLPNEKYQNVPIVALTANAVNGAREMFLTEGFQDYVAKPIDPAQLKRVIKKYLAAKIVVTSEVIQEKIEVETTRATNQTETGDEKKVVEDKIVEDNKAVVDNNAIDKKVELSESDKEETEELVILDERIGLQYCCDLEDMYQEFLGIYLENAEATMQELEQALSEDNCENYRTKIHALKSTSLQIGAVSLSERAKASEMACKEGDFDTAKNSHDAIVELYHQVVDRIKLRLQKENEG